MRAAWTTAFLVMAAAVAGSGCKASRWRKTKPETAGAEAASPPRQVAAADATAATGTPFEVDEKTGRAKAALVLRLDYFPTPRPGVTNLPSCYGALPADFELGVAVCDGRPDVRVPVLAKNLEQDCYTDPKDERVPVEVPLVLPGCKRGQILTHVFEPQLRVDVETRDVD